MTGNIFRLIAGTTGLLLLVAAVMFTWGKTAALGNPASTPMSDAAVTCGGHLNPVVGEIDLASGSDFWQVFPAAGKAPELAAEKKPVHLVVFAGAYNTDDLTMAGEPGFQQPATLHDVVCVVHSDNSIDIYFNIDRTGSKFDATAR